MIAPLVLIVDDNKEISSALSFAVGLLGLRTRSVSSGDAAMQAFADEAPAFGLIDLCLPVLSGWDVMRQLRARCPHLATVFVAITGLCDPVVRARAVIEGFDDYLLKPFGFDDVRRVLRVAT